jgi:hypothetical protein
MEAAVEQAYEQALAFQRACVFAVAAALGPAALCHMVNLVRLWSCLLDLSAVAERVRTGTTIHVPPPHQAADARDYGRIDADLMTWQREMKRLQADFFIEGVTAGNIASINAANFEVSSSSSSEGSTGGSHWSAAASSAQHSQSTSTGAAEAGASASHIGGWFTGLGRSGVRGDSLDIVGSLMRWWAEAVGVMLGIGLSGSSSKDGGGESGRCGGGGGDDERGVNLGLLLVGHVTATAVAYVTRRPEAAIAAGLMNFPLLRTVFLIKQIDDNMVG